MSLSSDSPLHALTRSSIQNSKLEKMPSFAARFTGIYRSEGIGALFAGVVPRTLWISAEGAVFLGVYESTIPTLMDLDS